MEILKAKIKKASENYKKGLNQAEKAVWLRILDFKAEGYENYKIEAIKEFRSGFPVFQSIWVNKDEITIKRFEDGQLKLF